MYYLCGQRKKLSETISQMEVSAMMNDNKSKEIKKDPCESKEGWLSRWLCYLLSEFGKYPISDDSCYGVHCY